jgi:hypothetical protein
MISAKDFSGFMRAIHADIRLEVILTDLISDQLDLDDIVIENDSLFKRSYHYDIESVDEISFGAGKRKKLRFIVNREGIYDQLPEDLFHQVSETKIITDKDEAIEEINEQRELEKQSRLFFQPIEQEFYNQRIKLEIEERKFLSETNSVLPGEIFDYLWDLPDFLDDLQKSKLGLLMPVIHKLSGKKELLPFIYESITGDPVEISETCPGTYKINEQPALDHLQLGLDSILGGTVTGLEPACTITILITDIAKLPDYMPGGKKIILHEFLCSLFMPMDTEFIFETAFTDNIPLFILEDDEVFQGRLNYSTNI